MIYFILFFVKTYITEGKPEPDVTWMKNGKPIGGKKKKDKRVKTDYDFNEEVYYLEVKDATADDAAEYQGTYHNQYQNARVRTIINIKMLGCVL